MGERHKQNMKADGRLYSNNRKNRYRNYASGAVWDHRYKEDYNRYYESQQCNYRQGASQPRDLATCFPPDYRHSNPVQDLWTNDFGGNSSVTNGSPSYYNQLGKYSDEHRSDNYTQHQNIYVPHSQYDYVAVATVSPIQQANLSWQQRNGRSLRNNKRRQDSDASTSCNHTSDNTHKMKKKKPLSQSVPNKREWTMVDAKKAINVEMEFSKRFKQNSLMIKFPDIDINKEIVSKFHNSIENVHFQQPSTARYCFVTLNDHADGDLVIKELNTTKFGEGYLMAEYKKERDNQIVSPEDIDPLTLYVGNLAQEITKQDLEQIYTKRKRIDIGFAMKMKKTRYAFISFWNVDDSIEAYTRTRSDVLYSKSLIVRFRRLHGTVGLPGEPKLQNPPKSTNINQGEHNEDANSSSDERIMLNPRPLEPILDDVEEELDTNCVDNVMENINLSQSCQLDERKNQENHGSSDTISPTMQVDLSLVKQEPDNINHDGVSIATDRGLKAEENVHSDIKPTVSQFESPFLPSYVINELMIQHTPIKEELASYGTSPAQIDEPSNAKVSECRSENDKNNSTNENFFEFEMDMVSSVDFNSIYKSIQPKPGS